MANFYVVAEKDSYSKEPVIWPCAYKTFKEAVLTKLSEIDDAFGGDDETLAIAKAPFEEFKDMEHIDIGEYIEIYYLNVIVVIRRVVINTL